ncbi:MAG: hypothetical protein AAF583_03670 [Pseudomonadota bacterium]
MRQIGLMAFASSILLASCNSWNTLNQAEVLPPEARLGESNEQSPPADRATGWQKDTFGRLVELVGHTYRGEPLEGNSEANADIQSWNWAIGGAALSINHALEDRSYGGETLIYLDSQTDALAYVYVTNAGFRTEGTFQLTEGGGWVAEEEVTGHPSITKVRSIASRRSDGSLMSVSEYFQNGEWTPGNQFLYREVFDIKPELDIPQTAE